MTRSKLLPAKSLERSQAIPARRPKRLKCGAWGMRSSTTRPIRSTCCCTPGPAKTASLRRISLSVHGASRQNLAQLPLENLAIGVARQRTLETQKRLRHLVVGEEVGAVMLKLGLIDCVTKHDEGMNALAKHRAGLCHHRDLDDG